MNLQEVQERFKNNPIVICLVSGEEKQIDSSSIKLDESIGNYWANSMDKSTGICLTLGEDNFFVSASILTTTYSFFNDGDHIGELEVPSNSTKQEIYELGMEHFFGEAITQSDILLDFEVFEE